MFCQNCGLVFPEGATFCSRCGGGLSSYQAVPSSQHSDTGESSTEVFSDRTEQILLSVDESDPEADSFDVEGWWKNCSMVKKTLVIAGIVLCCGIIIYLLVLLLKKLAGPLAILLLVLGCLVGSEESKKGVRKFVVKFSTIIVLAVIIGLLLLVFPDFIPNLIQPGGFVRNAYLTHYSEEVTIEEAFNNFFDNGKWSTYEEDGYSYVVFNGTRLYDGDEFDVRIRFMITGERFRVESLDVNGVSMGDLALGLLLEEVYEPY